MVATATFTTPVKHQKGIDIEMKSFFIIYNVTKQHIFLQH